MFTKTIHWAPSWRAEDSMDDYDNVDGDGDDDVDDNDDGNNNNNNTAGSFVKSQEFLN